MSLAILRRRAGALAGLLTLALVAGPAASAVCAHLGEVPAHDAETMHGTMEATPGSEAHGAVAHDMPAEPPCHGDVPETPPAPDAHDCASVCCASETPTPVPPAPAVAGVDVPAPVATEVAAPEAAAPVAEVPPPPSPPRGTRLHVEIGRFLI